MLFLLSTICYPVRLVIWIGFFASASPKGRWARDALCGNAMRDHRIGLVLSVRLAALVRFLLKE